MARELVAASFAMPAFTSYNADAIPFAYPPLAIYVAALTTGVLHVPLLRALQYLPLAANLLTIVAFCFLARSTLRSDYALLFAAAAFAIVPRGYEWFIMGG